MSFVEDRESSRDTRGLNNMSLFDFTISPDVWTMIIFYFLDNMRILNAMVAMKKGFIGTTPSHSVFYQVHPLLVIVEANKMFKHGGGSKVPNLEKATS